MVPVGFVAAFSALVTLAITLWLSPACLRTLRRLEVKVLASQAPFEVQPRVFDERFPHFVLYVQDAAAAATRWRGVFLASIPDSQGAAVTVAKDAQVISENEGNRVELHLGPGSTTNTIRGIRIATMSQLSAKTILPWTFPAALVRRRTCL